MLVNHTYTSMRPLYLALLALLCGSFGFSQVQTQGSYLNITRPGGGPVTTGDVLELRAVISIPSGTSITKLNFIGTVPAGTSFNSGSLKVVTNEGLVVAGTNTGNYTDAPGDDAANISGSTVSFFMGSGPTPGAGGSVTGGVTTPVFYATASIFMAAYQVTVTAASGSTISLAGAFHYKDATPTNITKNLPAYNIFISPPVTCSSSSLINLVTTETNGTFGSGTTLNRSTSSANVTGYSFVNLSTSPLGPVDGQYSIVNNTSTTGYSGGSPASSDKLFSVWDVIGDHTGSATGAGNPPAAPGSNKGYMLAVNASFAPAVVYNTTIGGLSASTNYTLSFWVRNICPACSNSPVDGSSPGTPGVKPNLSFDINGVNYFSTGEIAYSGSWVQRLFTFNTGALTSLTLTIKNNAPGGGGNDWVLDDLNITQCLLTLPVALTRFQAGLQPDGALLSWQTANEANTNAFYIERSTDGLRFLTIGRQAAKGGDGNNSYFFNDHGAPAGQTLYYRLRIMGKDDAYNYSNIIVLKDGAGLSSAAWLAPNPAHGSTTLYIKTAMGGTAGIRLINTGGREVYTQWVLLSAGQNAVLISLPGYILPGYYLVQTTTGNTTSWSRLVVD